MVVIQGLGARRAPQDSSWCARIAHHVLLIQGPGVRPALQDQFLVRPHAAHSWETEALCGTLKP